MSAVRGARNSATEVRDMNTSYESEIGLSEESASDSETECDAGGLDEPETEPRPDIPAYSNSAVK